MIIEQTITLNQKQIKHLMNVVLQWWIQVTVLPMPPRLGSQTHLSSKLDHQYNAAKFIFIQTNSLYSLMAWEKKFFLFNNLIVYWSIKQNWITFVCIIYFIYWNTILPNRILRMTLDEPPAPLRGIK